MDRVRVIKKSLDCYHAGWWSLIPFLGVFAALAALYFAHQARTEAGDEWNPARFYLAAGFILALVGFFISVTLTFLAMLSALS